MAYSGKYKGTEIDDALDKVQILNVSAEDMGEGVDDPDLSYVTKAELDAAIKSTLNTEV